MDEQEFLKWKIHNTQLNDAYKKYLVANHLSARDREVAKSRALNDIQRELEWPPFTNYCIEKSAPFSGITRYGLDSVTERCINEIDKIANGEVEYDY